MGEQEDGEPLEDSRMKPAYYGKPASLIDSGVFERSLTNYDANNLFHFLKQHFGDQYALRLIRQFRVGTPSGWPGASAFWQVNGQGEIRSGKIVLLDSMTGKPCTDPGYKPIKAHVTLNLKQFVLILCLFGEHQLNDRPTATVAIVANEVTAIIATAFYPDYVWLASEKTNYLDLSLCKALTGRNVILYPTLSKEGTAFDQWSRRAEEFRKVLNCQIRVSRYLEDHASAEERVAGLDIGDFLMRHFNRETGSIAKGEDGTPIQWDWERPEFTILSQNQPLTAAAA